MPTYEYACSECGGRFEVVQRITADPLTVCQQCGAEAIRRVIFPVGVVFKGSGFHINDYRKSSAPSTPESNSSSKSESGDSDKNEKEPTAAAADSSK